jgi:hypothetical protein
MTNRDCYNKMLAARLNQQARVLLEAAPGLLDQLSLIDTERGRTCHEVILSARADITGLLRRLDLPQVERASLIEMGLRNVCHAINTVRPAGAKMLDVVGQPDPADTHYGAARVAASYEIVKVTPDQFFAADYLHSEATP